VWVPAGIEIMQAVERTMESDASSARFMVVLVRPAWSGPGARAL
jgi:hypothetical protein